MMDSQRQVGAFVATRQRMRDLRWFLLPSDSRWLVALIAAFVIGYLPQLLTPFRVNTDSIRLHYMAIGLQEGVGLYGYGEKQFPPFFPALLAGIEQLGLANSYVFVGLNLLCLAVGLIFAARILVATDRFSLRLVLVVVFLTLASWITIKHVTLSLTDIPYFSVSMAALWAIEKSRAEAGHAYWRRIAIASLLTGVGIGMRTHGIAMIPPLFFAIASAGRNSDLSGRYAALARAYFPAVLVFAACAAPFVTKTDYFASASRRLSTYTVNEYVAGTLQMRCADLAEVVLNLPRAQTPPGVKAYFVPIGAIALALLAWNLARGFATWPASQWYLACYLAILFVWPFTDARFYLPVLPLMWATFFEGAPCELPHRRPFLWALLAWFIFTGSAALAWSTRISLSGDLFPSIYSQPLTNSYRVAFGQNPDPNAPPADPKVVWLIQHYQFGETSPLDSSGTSQP